MMRFKPFLLLLLPLVGCFAAAQKQPPTVLKEVKPVIPQKVMDDTSDLVRITAFNPNDKTQCKDISQTKNIRPDSCPPETQAKPLAFMAFANQEQPLKGFGIGDSIVNEEGACAQLDAKYSTYYQGLKFWDHAWVTAADAKRLGLGTGSQIKPQKGACSASNKGN